MANANFSELLRKPAFEAKKPEALPEGDYPGVIKSYEVGESQQKKTPYVRFLVQLTGWPDSLDESERNGDPTKRTLRRDFFLTEDALYRLDEFLKSIGVSGSGKSYEELLPEAIGASVIAQIKQYMNQRNNEIQNEIGNLTSA